MEKLYFGTPLAKLVLLDIILEHAFRLSKVTTQLEINSDIPYIEWYIKRVLNNADSTETVLECFPQQYHKYIENNKDTVYQGYWNSYHLFDEKAYKILEEADLNNILLDR